MSACFHGSNEGASSAHEWVEDVSAGGANLHEVFHEVYGFACGVVSLFGGEHALPHLAVCGADFAVVSPAGRVAFGGDDDEFVIFKESAEVGASVGFVPDVDSLPDVARVLDGKGGVGQGAPVSEGHEVAAFLDERFA